MPIDRNPRYFRLDLNCLFPRFYKKVTENKQLMLSLVRIFFFFTSRKILFLKSLVEGLSFRGSQNLELL